METTNDLNNRIIELTAENERLTVLSHDTAEVTQAYNESQSRFRAVFEASRLGNKIIDSNLNILQVNEAMVKLLGYAHKEDVIGKRIMDYAPPEQHKDWQHLQEQLWKHSAPSFSLETRLIRKDGAVIWCQVTSILFKDNAETLGYTIIEDITEKYNLRRQKEEFISVASHELKTPVTSLMATMQMMNRMLAKENASSEHLRKLARNAEKSTIKLTHLIADLLSVTKLEQGQLELNRTTFPVAEVLENCCTKMELEGIYALEVEGDNSTVIYGDQQKIEQVLVNLTNNAMKYAPGSAVITIRIEQLPKAVKISVVDKGPGIAPEHLGKLFDRYFRVEENHRTAGLGLGLYISGEIVRRHDGEIGVDSEPGQGSAFWFTLPEQA